MKRKPASPGKPAVIAVGSFPERDEIWRDVWRFSREPFKWLLRLSSASLVTVLALFIRAIEERDAEFFCAIAKRIESAPKSPTRKLARPVDPVRHVLATASFFDSRLGECLQPLERLDSILRAQGIRVDAKTIRRAAEDMGIRVANGKRGRPRKPDNS